MIIGISLAHMNKILNTFNVSDKILNKEICKLAEPPKEIMGDLERLGIKAVYG